MTLSPPFTSFFHTSLRGLVILLFLLACRAEAQEYDFVVAKDGSGDFTRVQEAIDAVPHLRKNTTSIFIRRGVYKEKLLVPTTKTNISFIGEGADKTILTYDDYASRENQFGEEIGTSGSASIYINGDGFEASDITFENSYGVGSQAVAARIDGDRVKFTRCRFLGNQDTLYPHGKVSRQYYENCYIEGTVDFIFGWSTAWFQNCTIYSKSAGYVTAASTDKDTPFGFIFDHCRFEGSAENGEVFLGRPWRPYAQTVVMNSYLSSVIREEGWDPWRSEEKKDTAYYAEYNNNGPGWKPKKRVSWSHLLNEDDVSKYTIENVFGDWNPLN